MTDIQNTSPPPKKTPFHEMRVALSETISPGDSGEEMLRRQAVTLDALFHFALQEGIGTQSYHLRERPHHLERSTLSLALQAQHQCQRTLKAIHAIDYMQALSYTVTPAAFRQPIGAPPVLKNDEQTNEP